MQRLNVTTIGAWCAVLMFPLLIAGGSLLSASGAGDLIPPTGKAGREWLLDVDSARGLFSAGGWVLILMGYLGLVAFVSFYYTLRGAGPFMIFAPILGTVGMTLVTIAHLIPIAMAYELAPAYANASGSEQATLAVTADTLAAASTVLDAAGNALGWGVVVPMYSFAILTTRALPRWIGWLGFVVAVFAGWLGLLAPSSSVIEGVSSIGFPAFFIFMLCMGIALLRRRPDAEDGDRAHSG